MGERSWPAEGHRPPAVACVLDDDGSASMRPI